MIVTHKENGDGSLEISLAFDAIDVKVLKHDLPGVKGIVEWYSKGPSIEKCYKCKERMIREEGERLRAKGVSLPADDVELINLIVSDADYKDREAREVVQ